MITLQVYAVDEVVVWRMIALRPAIEWRERGPLYWERRGEVILEREPASTRELVTAALSAIMTRLGERENLGGSGG